MGPPAQPIAPAGHAAGFAAWAASAPAPQVAPEPAPPPPCSRCGNAGLMTGVTLTTDAGQAVLLRLRDGTLASPTATICNQCGNVSLSADPQTIYQTLGSR